MVTVISTVAMHVCTDLCYLLLIPPCDANFLFVLQLAAELKIAAAFPAHPLMATALAACPDTAGGMCLVLPYAGVSFATIMGHPDWQGKLTQQERTDVFAELAAHTMTVHTVLQEQVRHACCIPAQPQSHVRLMSPVGFDGSC